MKTFNSVLALASLAIIALSSAPVQVNAIAADRAQVARHIRGHDAVAKRRRSASTASCIPRPSSTPPPPTSTPLPPTSTSPPTSTTSSTSSVAPSPTPSSGSKKWGLAFNADPSVLPNFHLSRVGFLYDWAPTLPSGIPSGVLGIPELRSWDQQYQFNTTVVPGYSSVVFGMNEPNEVSQANMSPEDGLALWMQSINPLAEKGYYRVSPACTNDDSGLTWYQQFFSLCAATPGCGIDAIAVHCYTTDIQSVIDYVTNLYNTFKLGVWITEIADQNYSNDGTGQPDMDEVWNFAGQLVDFVENTPWIEGVAPYGIVPSSVYTQYGVNMNNLLLGDDGYPTALGYYYFGNPL